MISQQTKAAVVDPAPSAPPAISGAVETAQAPQTSIAKGVTHHRKEINSFCKTHHTKALAWCLYLHAEEPRMLAEDLFDWLDEIGAKSPKKEKSWILFLCNRKPAAQKLLSDMRSALRDRHIPCNN